MRTLDSSFGFGFSSGELFVERGTSTPIFGIGWFQVAWLKEILVPPALSLGRIEPCPAKDKPNGKVKNKTCRGAFQPL